MQTKRNIFTIILIIVTGFAFMSKTNAQEILNNDLIRAGNGTEQSINAYGTLQQPFYYNSTSALWRKLTYSIYPLDFM